MIETTLMFKAAVVSVLDSERSNTMSHAEDFEQIGAVPTIVMAAAALVVGILPLLTQIFVLL